METITWTAVAVAVLLGVAWYLSYNAARLDRLHTRAEGALSALDAQLVRRSEATLELANSGALDPASALMLAGAASEALEAHNERALEEDFLEGQSFGQREVLESDLTAALMAALSADVVAEIRHDDNLGALALQRVEAAGVRVQLARRFHNDAVTDVRRVRRKSVVRLFRLAGHADLPRTVEFDDELPPAVRD
ncbi:membrane protein [Pedococcus aerophilus]|uniref:Membrane protein n=1 Tax=Pedococcus aerophilus TaxID=436356 RepID=A0ABN3UF08_9MICO